MKCVKCNQDIKSAADTVDDGMGVGYRLHKKCALTVTEVDLEPDDYQEVEATVYAPPLPDYIRKPGTPYPTGKAVDLDRLQPIPPARKAASESQPVSSTQCLVCHRGVQPGEDVATIGNATGHVSCLMELAKLLGREPAGKSADQAKKAYERSLVNQALSMYASK